MKKAIFILAFILLCVLGCFFSNHNSMTNNNDTLEDTTEVGPATEEKDNAKDTIKREVAKVEPFPEHLIVRTRDEIKYRTLVEHKGRQRFGSCVLTAIYSIEELDNITGKKLSTPNVGSFQLVMYLSHKGAYKPETIVLVCDGVPHQITPNFIQSAGSGKFILLFNIGIMNSTSTVPRDITKAKTVEIRVRYDNGDDIIKVSDKDQEAIKVMYWSFYRDGGTNTEVDGY